MSYTVRQWFFDERCCYRQEVSARTTYSRTNIFKNHIDKYIGDMILDELTEENIRGIYDTMKNNNYAFGTCYGTCAVIALILRSAFRNHVLAHEISPGHAYLKSLFAVEEVG